MQEYSSAPSRVGLLPPATIRCASPSASPPCLESDSVIELPPARIESDQGGTASCPMVLAGVKLSCPPAHQRGGSPCHRLSPTALDAYWRVSSTWLGGWPSSSSRYWPSSNCQFCDRNTYLQSHLLHLHRRYRRLDPLPQPLLPKPGPVRQPDRPDCRHPALSHATQRRPLECGGRSLCSSSDSDDRDVDR